jgi:3-hydroxyisobutyrate dehydrogenase
MRVAFIGLGVMGFPMAGHLAKAGHEVRVFNRSAVKAQAWAAEHAGTAFATASEAAQDCDLVALCVGNDEDVRGVVTEILPSLAANGLIVDHTTTSAKVAKAMALLAAQSGRAFLDAPVSGGQAGAVNGALTIMVGGDLAAYDRAVPVISAYAKAVRRMGEAGSGQLAKMVNQICIAGVVQGLAEAVHFAKNAGLDTDEVLAAISQGAAQSWQMDNRWKTMAEGQFEFGFAVDWMRKDLGLVLDEARTNGSHLAVTALVDQFYSEIQAMGGQRWDTSSLAARLER